MTKEATDEANSKHLELAVSVKLVFFPVKSTAFLASALPIIISYKKHYLAKLDP